MHTLFGVGRLWWFSYPVCSYILSESLLCHSTAVEVCLCLELYCTELSVHLLSCPGPGSSVGSALIPRERRGVGSQPNQGSSFFFEKRVDLGLLNCVHLPQIA